MEKYGTGVLACAPDPTSIKCTPRRDGTIMKIENQTINVLSLIFPGMEYSRNKWKTKKRLKKKYNKIDVKCFFAVDLLFRRLSEKHKFSFSIVRK